MANGVFNRGKKAILVDGTTIASQTVKAILLKSGYSFDATDNVIADLNTTSNEATVSGLPISTATGTNRVTLTLSVGEDDSGNFAYVDADDITFVSVDAAQVIGGCVVYIDQADDTLSEVLSFYDLTNTTSNGGDIVVQWATPAGGGILKLA